MTARVLVVGSGGREHALGVALSRSSKVGALAFAGGPNAGLERIAERLDPAVAEDRAERFDLVVIGPEAPLVDGLADRLAARGVAVFGPSAAAARIEASKAFTKEICAEAQIPTAAATVAHSEAHALDALEAMAAPPVVKADGLAAGKGVTVADTFEEARAAIGAAFGGAFGAAGASVLLEERLVGREVSLFALSDGRTVRPLGTARDYKRALDGDRGANTGGMGAVSPAPDVPEDTVARAMDAIVTPALDALRARGTPFVGCLYAGLILTDTGPKLIEFNARFGDPECQVLLPRLETDLFELLRACAGGELDAAPIRLADTAAVGVTVSAAAYPEGTSRGEEIGGLDAIEEAGARVIHAGTRRAANGCVLSNGGRVLTVVAQGPSAGHARERVYSALAHLHWPGGRYRRDIGL